ncbi:MAG: hypothetical protein CVU08_14930 [Bacteroidetes bacterium HGW-Bacteroidetes-3]|nr:MAG: hypothetical protein CVU08_14930 [Bacteroidetes bacterium HGW-Bacteroidetes-3]
MKKFQSTLNCFYKVFIVIFSDFSSLLSYSNFHRIKTGFLAGFLFFMESPFLIQTNIINIPYNFYNKTLHI